MFGPLLCSTMRMIRAFLRAVGKVGLPLRAVLVADLPFRIMIAENTVLWHFLKLVTVAIREKLEVHHFSCSMPRQKPYALHTKGASKPTNAPLIHLRLLPPNVLPRI